MASELTRTDTRTALAVHPEALISGWLEFERAEGASQNTIKAYRKGIDVFTDWLQENGRGTGEVTPQTIRQFKADLTGQYAAQTVNLRLSAVRSFYRYMVATDWMPYNPAESVKGAKRPKSRTHKRDALANSEVRAVLATCDRGTMDGIRDYAILALMAYCGLRTVEVHRADVGDLKTQGDRLVLAVQGKGRTEKDEIAVIPPSAEGAIRAWITHRMTFRDHAAGDPLFVSLSRQNRGERLSLRAIRGMVKARFREAGVVGDKSTHSLRHSAITNAIRQAKRQGRSPLDVQTFARHASFDTTLGYVHEFQRLDDPIEDLIDYGTNGK